MYRSEYKSILRLLFFVTILLTVFYGSKNCPFDWDGELHSIAGKFRKGVFDKGICRATRQETTSFIDNIDSALQIGNLNYEDSIKLDGLKHKAVALEHFINTIGEISTSQITNEEFSVANGIIKGKVSQAFKNKFCLDIVEIRIENFVSYLAQNKSGFPVSLTYKWSGNKGKILGNGVMDIDQNSFRQICCNRNYPKVKKIVLDSLSCSIK